MAEPVNEQRAQFMTVPELANAAYLTDRKVRLRIGKGDIRSIKINGQRLVPSDEAERVIEVERFKVAQERYRRRQQRRAEQREQERQRRLRQEQR